MQQFIPESRYTREFWQKQYQGNVGGDWEMEFNLGPETWIAKGVYLNEFMAPFWGYTYQLPTVTDALYWFRYVVFNAECDAGGDSKDIKLDGVYEQLAQRIDTAPAGTQAEDLVQTIRERYEDRSFNLVDVLSIHAYLSELASEQEWRIILNDPAIKCEQEKWNLASEHWEVLHRQWNQYLIDEFWQGPEWRLAYETFLSNRGVMPIEEAAKQSGQTIDEILTLLQSKQLKGLQLEPEHFKDNRARVNPPYDWFIFEDEAS